MRCALCDPCALRDSLSFVYSLSIFVISVPPWYFLPQRNEGHERSTVRNYWTRQWKILDPHVDPIQYNNEDERINVTVHQVVHDIEGNLLVDQIIHHVYTFEDGLIKAMEIQKPG